MNIFQKIIAKDIHSDIIYEDDKVIAFLDINPKSPGHFLVVPKTFSKNIQDMEEKDLIYLFSKARELANEQIKKLGVSSYKLETNAGIESGQEILHTHIHIIPSIK